MRDVGQAIRQAYFEALQGNVVFEGNAIPFVDEKLDIDINEQNIYVLFTTQDEEGQGVQNKTKFVSEVLLKMVIVNQRQATSTKETVEDISNQILQTLFPTRTTWSVSLASPLSLTYARFVNAQYNPLVQTDQGFQISKVLTFKNRITQ
jgi:hypothetical protein